ncbi:MAG: hypothetical protein ACJAWV_003243 [Flammeovirgaceae bacterium]|jgi:hypothetical protein
MKNETYTWFLLYISFVLLAYFLSNEFIYTEELYYNSISEDLTVERVEDLLARKAEYWWLVYAILPVIEFISLVFTASLLCLGLFLYDLPINFSKCFRIAIWASFIFLIPSLLRTLWFLFFEQGFSLADLKEFPTFSLLMFFDKESLPKYIIYPIYSFNLFRIGYFVILAVGVQKLFQKKLSTSFGLVLSTVGVWLVLLNVLVVFLTVLNS